MAQHFTESSASRGILSVMNIARMTDQEAFYLLCLLRWRSIETQECPSCGVCRKHHFIKTRSQFRCAEKECCRTFSVTSGTKFAYHKKSYRDILYAAAMFANGVEGVSAARTAANMGAGHKSTRILNHKIREALYQTRDISPMHGEIEVDGCYFHYYVRPKNYRFDRIDRRLQRNMNPNKRAVFVIRMRDKNGKGAWRTIVEVIKNENEKDVRALILKYVTPGSTIFADENPCYASLASHYEVKQVNHSEAYSDDGVNENQAESFFARLRKQHSIIHRCDPNYLNYYANEIAWRDDNRRMSFTDQFEQILTKCLQSGPSLLWSKYWQGNHPSFDTLFTAGKNPMD